MAGVNISSNGLTYIRYLDGVVETLNQESKARLLVRQDDKWTGEKIEGRVHTERNPAIRYAEDGGAFPVPKAQVYQPYNAFRKFVHGAIQLTDGVMATASGNKNVARDVISSEVKGLMKSILKFENGFFFRNGDGSVSTIQSVAPSAGDLRVTDARMLWDGASYDVYDSALATKRGSVTVAHVDSALESDEATLSIDESSLPSGTAATDLLVWSGSLNRAITGLDKLVDDAAASFQGINVANFPKYSSHVMDNSGTNRDLSPSLFRQMLAGMLQKSGNQKPAQGLKVLCSSWQAINVEELYEGEMRLDPSSKVAGLAVSSFQTALGKIDIIVDVDALYNKMFFVDFSKIYRAVQKRLSWRRQGGSIFKRSDVAGVWTATALEICELYIKERFTSGKIEDLNESHTTPY